MPGVGPWDEILKSPLLWHFRFGGPDMERLVKGRERIYLDRFWNEFSADPEELRRGVASALRPLYARPGAMHSGFEQFKAFDQDVIDNKAFLAKGPLTMPVLAIGGEKSFGPMMAVVMRAAATNVQRWSSRTPATGSWKNNPPPRSPRSRPSCNDADRIASALGVALALVTRGERPPPRRRPDGWIPPTSPP